MFMTRRLLQWFCLAVSIFSVTPARAQTAMSLPDGDGKPPAQMPKINVNKITADGLAGALPVPKNVAAAIVEYREKNGPFKKWEDLEKVPGLDIKKIQSEKDRFEFDEK